LYADSALFCIQHGENLWEYQRGDEAQIVDKMKDHRRRDAAGSQGDQAEDHAQNEMRRKLEDVYLKERE
jgi:hypothetical protein